jgi:hypothetical protein
MGVTMGERKTKYPSLFWLQFAVAATALLGCSGSSGPPPVSEVFGARSTPLHAMIVTKKQDAVQLAALTIHGCPTQVCRRSIAPVIEEYHQEVAEIDKQLLANSQATAIQQELLEKTQAEISSDYNERVPSSSEEPAADDRNRLRKLTKLGAQKTKADAWLAEAIAARVDPITDEINVLKSSEQSLLRQKRQVQSRFNSRVFEGLPTPAMKQWKTDANGRAMIGTSADDSWTLWASTSRQVGRDVEYYRWIVEIPRDLDANGKIFLDNESLLDERGFGWDAALSESEQLRGGAQ